MTTIFMKHKEKARLLPEKMLFSLLKKVILNFNDGCKRNYSVRSHGEIYIYAMKKKIKFYEQEKFRYIFINIHITNHFPLLGFFLLPTYLYRIVITCLQTTL